MLQRSYGKFQYVVIILFGTVKIYLPNKYPEITITTSFYSNHLDHKISSSDKLEHWQTMYQSCCFRLLQKPPRQLEALDHENARSLYVFSSLKFR